MYGIVSGITGTRSSHTVFINILIGRFLSFLFSINRAINWYVWLQFICILISAVISSLLLESLRKNAGIILSVGLNAFFYFDAYVNMQFTKTGGVLAVTGALFCLWTYYKKKPLGFYAFGALFIFLGGLFRINSSRLTVLCVLVVTAVSLVCDLVKSSEKKKEFIRAAILAVSLLIGLGAVEAARLYNVSVYQADPEWKEYREFNLARSDLMDHKFPKYEDHQEEFEAMGLNENDVYLYRHWTFEDPELFTIEKINNIISIRNAPDLGDAWQIMCEDVFLGQMKYTFLVPLLLLFVLLVSRNKINWIIVLVSLCLILALDLYFCFSQRYLQKRVDFVMFFSVAASLACVLCAQIKEIAAKLNWKRVLAVSLCLITTNLGTVSQAITSSGSSLSAEKQVTYREVYDRISEDQEHLYLTVTGCFKGFELFDFFDEALPEGYYSNVFYLGSWLTNSPEHKGKLDRYGIQNPFRDCVNNENVYFIADQVYMSRIISYLQDHYNGKAKSKKVDTAGAYNVYQVIAK